jgi:DNA-binding HxlR family transcriptional regulator
MAISKTAFRPEYVLEKIGGKWKMPILWQLSVNKVMRYGELRRVMNGITHKMLSQQLKELEQDGFILRTVYPQIPPKVEYSLTDKGELTLPAIKALCTLGTALNDTAMPPQDAAC